MTAVKVNALILKVVLLLCVLLHWSPAHSRIYIVGDSKGWSKNVSGWENDKSFKAGDILVFKYGTSTRSHDVVVVDKSSYDSCTWPAKGKRYTSGNDKITLKKGPNYFICGYWGHCYYGMKIAVNAA
ncbi:early nodulin-like protein 22 [Striga asiatica]|uniref:Basic blue protein n=1 Tax=Striga asiatica TaxID=4170 RepID=A0A5A7P907_STRAF|nr:early nodulin-like protein 22 [Striga asiatica]